MVATRLIAAIVVTGLAPALVFAQASTPAPSPAVACLTLTPGAGDKLEYPEEMLRRKDGGSVRVELVFRAPDAAPRVEVLSPSENSGLIHAVTEHVERFRVPCMHAGDPPVTLRQQYVFDPRGGRKVMFSAPVDAADATRRAQLGCMKHVDGADRPTYPVRSIEAKYQGNILLRARFTAPDRPPDVEWLAESGHRSLRGAVEYWVAGLRLPCLQQPVSFTQVHQFRIEGGERVVLKDVSLQTLLAGARDLSGSAFFDFNTMACPFEVRLTYYRPYLANYAEELDAHHPSRGPFLRWLSGLTLNLPERLNLSVLGDTTTVAVPCGILDL